MEPPPQRHCSTRSLHSGSSFVSCAAKLRGAVELLAKVGRRRGHMVLVVGQIVGCLEPTEGAQVIQLAVRPGHLQFFVRGGGLPASA